MRSPAPIAVAVVLAAALARPAASLQIDNFGEANFTPKGRICRHALGERQLKRAKPEGDAEKPARAVSAVCAGRDLVLGCPVATDRAAETTCPD